MSKIAITDYFSSPDVEKEILGDLVGIDVNDDTEVLLVWHERINEQYIKKLSKLKGVQRYGVGYDNLDLSLLHSKGIVVCNNPDYGVDEVSDTTVAMIMNIARGVSQYDSKAKNYFNTWQENVIPNIKRSSETVVGVIGAGRIGGSVILKCNAMRFQTIFYDPYKERGYEKLINSKRVEFLEELLSLADIVAIHTPLTDETNHLIDERFLNAMKAGASLVNTARGGLFKNLDLLYDNLKSYRLSNLAIDVLEDEPPKSCKLIDAWRNSEEWLNGRLIINPHTSYFSMESLREMRIKAATNALRMLQGKVPYYQI